MAAFTLAGISLRSISVSSETSPPAKSKFAQRCFFAGNCLLGAENEFFLFNFHEQKIDGRRAEVFGDGIFDSLRGGVLVEVEVVFFLGIIAELTKILGAAGVEDGDIFIAVLDVDKKEMPRVFDLVFIGNDGGGRQELMDRVLDVFGKCLGGGSREQALARAEDFWRACRRRGGP